MTRILVVADDPELGVAVQAGARTLGVPGSVRVVRSAPAALAAMAEEQADLVVTDIHVPGSEGPAWLHALRDRWPHVARVIVSGDADAAMLEQAYAIARHVLATPCAPATLAWALGTALDGVRAVDGTEAHAKAVQVVERVGTPGVFMAHFAALREALEAPNPPRGALRQAIEASPLLTLRVLRLANSPWYGGGAPVTSVADALARLGPELLRGLLLSLRTLDERSMDPDLTADLRLIKRHVHLLARIMRRVRAGQPDESLAATAALLHDVGRVVVALGDPAVGRQVDYHSTQSGQVRHEVELDIASVRDADVGAVLLENWGIPAVLRELVRGHALPSIAGPEAPPAVLGPLHVAHARIEAAGLGSAGTPHTVDLGYLERHGLTEFVATWDAVIDDELARAVEAVA
ncbi:MAG: HDOD domain-containing protein [Gemmatimonadetes bacterium]|nr:HDOD domain-containing protein [Gemmatimonadota bacterium]